MNIYTIRNMTATEVKDIATRWAVEEGWNPSPNDAQAFYNTDTNGFFVGLLDNIPIACISAVSYGGTFGFIGFYIVKKEFRGKGYGSELLKRAEEHAKSKGCRHVHLDTFGFQAKTFYEKLGYVDFGVLANYPSGQQRYFMTKSLA